MPYPNKKQRLTGDDANLAEPMTDRMVVAAGCLSSADVLPNIFGFLHVEDVMRQRGVNKRWKEAVKKTNVPLQSYFFVDSTVRYHAMAVMTEALSTGVLIVGAGPAGICAAQTCVAAGLHPIVVDEASQAGGQIYRRR